MTAPNSAVLATRGSMLALWQANFIAGLLKRHGLEVTLSVIKTTGDIVQDRFLHEIGGKGLFIKELEEAMRGGLADLAMHSLKDLDGFFRSTGVDVKAGRKSAYEGNDKTKDNGGLLFTKPEQIRKFRT